MLTIYKYTFPVANRSEILVPSLSTPLSVQSQGGSLCLWAAVVTESDEVPVRVRVFGTGMELDWGKAAELNYLATVQQGEYVWHVFTEGVPNAAWKTRAELPVPPARQFNPGGD